MGSGIRSIGLKAYAATQPATSFAYQGTRASRDAKYIAYTSRFNNRARWRQVARASIVEITPSRKYATPARRVALTPTARARRIALVRAVPVQPPERTGHGHDHGIRGAGAVPALAGCRHDVLPDGRPHAGDRGRLHQARHPRHRHAPRAGGGPGGARREGQPHA